MGNSLIGSLSARGLVVADVGCVATGSRSRLAAVESGAVYVAVVSPAYSRSKPCLKEMKRALELGESVVAVTVQEDCVPQRLQHVACVHLDEDALRSLDVSPALERLIQELARFRVGLQDAASIRPPSLTAAAAAAALVASSAANRFAAEADEPEFDAEELSETTDKLAHVAQLALQDDGELGEFVSTNGIQWTVAHLERMYSVLSLAATACLAVVHLAARDEATARLCLDAGAVGAVCEAMECHRDSGALQMLGVRALRLLALERKVLNEGCIEACLAAMRQYGEEDHMLMAEGCRFVTHVATQGTTFGERGREMLVTAGATALCRKAAQTLSAPTYLTTAGAAAVACLS